jgi:LmbE family N-acetylglucosaminyl deacetylase
MLVIAQHPDDETLATGGLIARKTSKDIPVHVVAVTDGENAYSDRVSTNLASPKGICILVPVANWRD